MEGAFNLRPPEIKYHAIQDVNILLHNYQNINTDSFMNKRKKIVCLMMLLSGTRVNTFTHERSWFEIGT